MSSKVPDKLDEDAIRRRMRIARDRRRLSRQRLGDMLGPEGRTATAVQQYEEGRRHAKRGPDRVQVPYDLLPYWAKATGVSLPWLLYGEEVIPEKTVLERLDRIERALERLAEEER
jgi:transcriptional regulator with XRE-family HTH domain